MLNDKCFQLDFISAINQTLCEIMIGLLILVSFLTGTNCQAIENPNSSDLDVYANNKTAEDVRTTVRPTVKTNDGYRLQPLAAGGIGLLSGLLIISATIGIFILVTKRKNNFVYEAAPKGDVIQHI